MQDIKDIEACRQLNLDDGWTIADTSNRIDFTAPDGSVHKLWLPPDCSFVRMEKPGSEAAPVYGVVRLGTAVGENALTPANPTAHSPTGPSDKSALAAFFLCLFLGVVGAHRFYVGRYKTGIAQLLTQGGFVIWAVIDLVLIVLGRFKDSDERPVTRWS